MGRGASAPPSDRFDRGDAVGVGIAGVGLSGAIFTDSVSVGGNAFTTGTVDISTSPTATNTVGDASQGSQTGDRTLSASGNEVLCYSVALPTSAGNSVQSATTTATFDVVAEQTANN